MTKIGYLGPEGTFSYWALLHFLTDSGKTGAPAPYPSFQALVSALIAKEVDSIVLPMENSIEGIVTPVFDLLVGTDNIVISEGIQYPIHHFLMAKQAFLPDQLTDIYSHPQPLAQCAHYLTRTCPSAHLVPTRSTADAVSKLDAAQVPAALIGPEELATRHNLQILASCIEDHTSNQTLFGLITLGDSSARDFSKDQSNQVISIVFSTKKDQPGSLHTALGEFASRGINLSKIASRPTKNAMGDYLFFIDIVGDINDLAISEVLEIVAQKSLYFKILGAYHIHHVRS
ncbi:MAG: prephenate dehydratase [bacterium]|nr:prephenate dehydratase [bacterium]